MPNYTFSIFKSDTGNQLSTFPSGKEYYLSTVNTSITAETYIERFIKIASLSSTSLGSISAAVDGLDGLGQSFS